MTERENCCSCRLSSQLGEERKLALTVSDREGGGEDQSQSVSEGPGDVAQSDDAAQ